MRSQTSTQFAGWLPLDVVLGLPGIGRHGGLFKIRMLGPRESELPHLLCGHYSSQDVRIKCFTHHWFAGSPSLLANLMSQTFYELKAQKM